MEVIAIALFSYAVISLVLNSSQIGIVQAIYFLGLFLFIVFVFNDMKSFALVIFILTSTISTLALLRKHQ